LELNKKYYLQTLIGRSLNEISGKKKIKVSSLLKFPSVKRDLALLIDEKVTFKEIYNLSFQVERNLLKDVGLFDVYQGDKLPEGKKSYAVSFVLQDSNKTLKDAQIDKIMQKLQQSFEKKFRGCFKIIISSFWGFF
jgi:phenylalanyl-tRNA synthetase beta chain